MDVAEWKFSTREDTILNDLMPCNLKNKTVLQLGEDAKYVCHNYIVILNNHTCTCDKHHRNGNVTQHMYVISDR